MTLDEWEKYEMTVLSKKLNDEENSAEFEEYQEKMKTPVQYTNGKYYKPIWAEIYSGKVKEIFPDGLLI